MKDINFNISYYSVAWFILLGVGIFLLFRFIKKLVNYWVPEQKNRQLKFERLLPVVEGIVWFSWVIWGVQGVFNNKLVYTLIILGIMLVIIVALSWFAIRDFIAGVVLKLEGAFTIGERIKVQALEGRVKELGYFGVKLENFRGEIISIPYHTVSGVTRVQPKSSEAIKNHSFQLDLPKRYTPTESIDKLRELILNTPWASVTKRPYIKLSKENEVDYTFEIIIYSLHPRYFQKTETYLQKWSKKLV
ncbi:mechanosensitive ion channel family protein [uncultured Microscilla sp.]|uniref:mechanosensitive ion channel family protein n=1 Tax=uncultured Microscilla sp. TaxID=432653 RepID=UPI00261DE08B|nr:mechanosensitive ion channel family protein [uncultured Microscilla sp.]